MRVGPDDPKRLQDFLAAKLKLSRRAAKEIIDGRRAWVNRKCVWIAGFALRGGDEVETSKAVPKAPVKFHVRVLWSDANYLVCDKPAGVVTCGEGRSAESILREQEGLPLLVAVHRLDRDPTGCVLFAKTEAAREAAVEVFRTRRVSKTYHAIGAGEFKYQHQKIDAELDGESAVSLVTREMQGDGACFLRVRIETGRTNQIRRHLASVRWAVVGGRVLGLRRARDPRLMQVPRQMLHASTLSLPNPLDPHAEISVHSPLPDDFRAALGLFGMGKGKSVRKTARARKGKGRVK